MNVSGLVHNDVRHISIEKFRNPDTFFQDKDEKYCQMLTSCLIYQTIILTVFKLINFVCV